MALSISFTGFSSSLMIRIRDPGEMYELMIDRMNEQDKGDDKDHSLVFQIVWTPRPWA